MADRAMILVSELLAATADAHSPRALVRALATTLAAHAPVVRVELRAPAPRAAAVLANGDWSCVEATDPAARELAPGLAVIGAVPEHLARDDVRAALGQVVAAAARHLDVVARVAQLSRRAHAEN